MRAPQEQRARRARTLCLVCVSVAVLLLALQVASVRKRRMHLVLGRLSLGAVVCDGNVYCGACWDVQPPLGPVEPFPYVGESFYDAVGFAPIALEYWADNKTAGATLLFPVWPVWSSLGILSMRMFVLWQRRRMQILAHRCALCGYDLTGNVSGRCPECGTHIPASTPGPMPE